MKHAPSLLIFLALATAAALSPSLPADEVQAATNEALSGFAWSDTIGWISFSCTDVGSCSVSNYAVTVDGVSGNLSGYAWSDTIGWISFQSSDVTGCPQSPCPPKIENDGTARGWARALSQGSGWDGWISLSGVSQSGTSLSGFSWGSDVVGWVDWNLVRRASEDDLLPDLTAGATLTTPTSGVAGQNLPFSASVSNIGESTATNFPNIFQIANDDVSATIALIDAGTISSLGVGASQDISGAYTFSSAGTYTVRACANFNTSWGGSTPESNSTNNCGGWTTLTISGAVPVVTFWADPAEIDQSQTTRLKWTSASATSCTSAGGFDTGGATSNTVGVQVGPLFETTPYAITCTGAGGSTNANTVVIVEQPQADISASPLRVPKNSPSTVTWSASGVKSCVVAGPGLSSSAKTGSETVSIVSQSVFSITCQTNGNPVTDSVIVNVNPGFGEF